MVALVAPLTDNNSDLAFATYLQDYLIARPALGDGLVECPRGGKRSESALSIDRAFDQLVLVQYLPGRAVLIHLSDDRSVPERKTGEWREKL